MFSSVPHYRHVWLWAGTGRRPDRDSYTVAWYELGRLRKRSFPTPELADRFRAWLEARLNGWLLGPPPTAGWRELADRWLQSLSGRSPDHQAKAARVLRRYEHYAHPVMITDFQPDAIERYLIGRAAEVGSQTVRGDYQYLRSFGYWLVRMGHLQRNPALAVSPPQAPRPLRRVPAVEEWLRLLEAIPGCPVRWPAAWHICILLAATTGVRRGGILAARWPDIEIIWEQPPIALWTATQKGRRQTLHGLPAPVTAQLLAYQSWAFSDQRLFPWRIWPRREWALLCGAARFPYTFHALRAAAGMRLALRAIAAGAAGLDHSSPHVFLRHYADLRELQLELARQMELPALPPLPNR